MSKQFEHEPWRAVRDAKGRIMHYTNGFTGLGDDYVDDLVIETTHLTDAECAAEYWRMRWLVTGMARRFKGDSHLPDLFPVKEGDLHRFYDEMHTLQRFMEHPHAT